MSRHLDAHGQPENHRFNAARRADRTIHEMLGLVKGLIVDGEVTEGEAQFLEHWIKANPESIATWPGDVLSARLTRVFTDGTVTEDERDDLLYFLQKMVGPDHGQHGHA